MFDFPFVTGFNQVRLHNHELIGLIIHKDLLTGDNLKLIFHGGYFPCWVTNDFNVKRLSGIVGVLAA